MFEVGKEVLCINSKGVSHLNKGEKYELQGIRKAPCCGVLTLDVGLGSPDNNLAKCRQCNGGYDNHDGYYLASRFVPIDNSLSETTVEQLLSEPIEI